MRNFNHSVNVLVKAYLNNWLIHRKCTACAVGNLISEGNPEEYDFYQGRWYSWFRSLGLNSMDPDFRDYDHPDVIKTGYSPSELISIERAFERCDRGCNEDDYMFNGLMAVVDVLAEIHGVDLTQKETAKALFVKL